MKILVVNIALRPNTFRKFIPIGLGYVVSSIKRAGYNFDLLDLDAHPQSPEETEKFFQENRYDIVLMGCIVTGYKYVKWLSRAIKDAFLDTTIIVGNSVASSIPDILLTRTSADIAVIGEGDITIVDLLNCIKQKKDIAQVNGISFLRDGKIIKTPPHPVIPNIDTIPVIDWEIFDIKIYIDSLSISLNEPLPPIPKDQIRAIPVNTARGCPYHCTFCYHVFSGKKYRYRSPLSIIGEMRKLHERYGINLFTFNDELTFFSLRQAFDFANKLIESGLKVWWDADCRSGMFSKDEDIEVAGKLKEAGCVALSYSLESASPDILRWMDKNVGAKEFSRQREILDRAGLPSLTSIVLGYPNETEKTIVQTIDCCIENKLYPSAGYLLPQPGTPMYDFAVKNGFIKDEEQYLLTMGDRQDLRLNMTGLSDEQLTSIVERELNRCSKALNISVDSGKLLKTGYYRVAKK